MKQFVGVILIIVAIIGGIYIGGWLCLCESIADIVFIILNGTVTTLKIAWDIFKIFIGTGIATFVAYLIASFGIKLILKD